MITGIEKSMDKVTKEVIALQNKIANKVLETQLQNALEDMGKDDSIADTIREKHFSKGVPVTYGDLEDPKKVITEYPDGRVVIEYV